MAGKYWIIALVAASVLLLNQGGPGWAAAREAAAAGEEVRITSVDPSRVEAGSKAMINGAGFSESKEDLLVIMGRWLPEIKISGHNLIVIEVPKEAGPGPYKLTVRNLAKNIASEPFDLEVGGELEGLKKEAPGAVGRAEPGARPERLVLAAGTPVVVRLMQAISSDKNRVGQRVSLVLESPLMAGEVVVAEKGSQVAGRITHAEGSKRVKGRAELAFTLTGLTPLGSGDSYTLVTNSFSAKAEDTKGKDTAIVGGGTGAGALLGALTSKKKGKGAVIGGLLGAGAGTAVVLGTKGKEVEFDPDTTFTFTLEAPIAMR